MRGEEERLTACPLVFYGGDDAFLPPIDGLRQLLAGHESVPVAGRPCPPSRGRAAGPGTQVRRSELLVREVSELVELETVPVRAGVGGSVMAVDEAEVVTEDLESALPLAQRVVPRPVRRRPGIVHPPHLLLAALQARHAVLLVVADDGRVWRGGGTN